MEEHVKKKLLGFGVKEGDKVGIAVSGGVDSMSLLNCLCNLCAEMNIIIIAYHMEHGIRGKESISDMEFVLGECERMGVKCIAESANVPVLAGDEGISVETAARKARYDFLERQDADYIATAHHMDDVAETVIMNLVRGSGLAGLAGIPERRERFIRPLLGISRREIEEYADKNKIAYVSDSTNDDTGYTRNYIRKEILPGLERVNKAAAANIARTAAMLAEDELSLAYAAQNAGCIEKADDGVYIGLKKLSNQQEAVKKRIIRLAIGEVRGLEDVENVHVQSVLSLAEKARSAKRVDLGGGVYAAVVYNKLMIGKQCAKSYNYISMTLRAGSFDFAGIEFECGEYKGETEYGKGTEYFDAKAVEGAEFRHRKEGDVIAPLGLGGTKRLCDYLSDRKVPLHKRDSLVLLTKDNEVFWVVGVGVSETSKVRQNSKILRIRYWEK